MFASVYQIYLGIPLGSTWQLFVFSTVYSPKGAYFQSKGAQILCTKYLARKAQEEQDPVTCCSLHPGVIYTDLYDHTTLYKMAAPVLKKIWKVGRKDSVLFIVHFCVQFPPLC